MKKKYKSNSLQLGIGTVDLLIYMVMAGILGTVLVNSLSGSRENARIAVARDFFQTKVYTAAIACIARDGDLRNCDKDEIVKYNNFSAEQQTSPWGDEWQVISNPNFVAVKYPLDSIVVAQRQNVFNSISTILARSSVGATASFGSAVASSGDFTGRPSGSYPGSGVGSGNIDAEDMEVVYVQK